MSRAQKPRFARRQALAAGLAGAAAVAALPAVAPGEDNKPIMNHPERMPVVYLPHGGGPWPFVDVGLGDKTGAAGSDRGTVAYNGTLLGLRLFAYHFA